MNFIIGWAIEIIRKVAIFFGLAYSSIYGLREFHDFMREKAIEKITQGLSSSEEFAQKLTGKKFDWYYHERLLENRNRDR